MIFRHMQKLDFSHLRGKGIDTLLTLDAPEALIEVPTPYQP
jgi:hypothetical protein